MPKPDNAPSPSTRRHFLKTSTALVGGTLVGGQAIEYVPTT